MLFSVDTYSYNLQCWNRELFDRVEIYMQLKDLQSFDLHEAVD
jgi:hypothetical protein